MSEVKQDGQAEKLANAAAQIDYWASDECKEIRELFQEENVLRDRLEVWKESTRLTPTEIECYEKNTKPIIERLVEIEREKKVLRGDGGSSVARTTQVAQAKPGTQKRWTPEFKAEVRAYRAKHTEHETAEKFGVSGSLIRRKLAEENPKISHFSGLVRGNR